MILLEFFIRDETITFIAMFNMAIGVLCSAWVFAKHSGYKFAAKYKYVFKE